MLGIAVITYARQRWLRQCVDSVIELTGAPFELVVADDGGDDGTVEWCRERKVRVVTGRNRGVAHNKNRALLALEAVACDPILLLEDDLRPSAPGWEREWVAATARWHHVAYATKNIIEAAFTGRGVAEDPWVSSHTRAQLLTVSGSVLEAVGYLDPRFEGWGHEHAEWTTRIKRAGYGYKKVMLPSGKSFSAQLFLDHGLLSEAGPSWRDIEQARRNRELTKAIWNDPLYRAPWRTPQERAEILEELRVSGIDAEPLAARVDARAQASVAR
jgi:glycosyltransferase involved in cell wall biosynthesis